MMRRAILAVTVLAAAAIGSAAQANCGAQHDAQAAAPGRQASAPATGQPAQSQSLDQASNQAAKTPPRTQQ